MKRHINIYLQFIRKYWPELKRCAALTVELWTALAKLAPDLAKDIAEAGQNEQ